MRYFLRMSTMFLFGGLSALIFMLILSYFIGLQQVNKPANFPLYFGDINIMMKSSDQLGDQVFFVADDSILNLSFDKLDSAMLDSAVLNNRDDFFVSYRLRFSDDVLNIYYFEEGKCHWDLNGDGEFDVMLLDSSKKDYIYYDSKWLLVNKVGEYAYSDIFTYRFDVEKGWVKE